jgi:mono/diheme cytochrome c family protein
MSRNAQSPGFYNPRLCPVTPHPQCNRLLRSMPNPRALWLCLAGQIILAVSPASAQNDATRFETKVLPVLAKNCFPCHGADVQTADVNFSVFHDGKNAAEKPELWRKVRDKIRNHLMPPPPIPGLSAADADAVTGWIDSIVAVPGTVGAPETVLAAPNPGRVTARRLNRLEYNNTIRDFLGVAGRPADDFPIDNQGYGFDNIGDVLTLSPMLMEKYMAAARSVSRVAVYGETYEKKPGLIGKLLPKSVQDDGQLSGDTLPFSIRGDLEGVYRFPVEADYVLQFRITNRRGSSPPVDLSAKVAGPAATSGGRGGRRTAAPGRGMLTLTDEDKKALLEADRNSFPPVELDIDVDSHQVLKDTVEGNDSYAYSRGPTVVKVHLTAGEHTIHAYFPANANLDNPRTNLNPDGRHRLSAEILEIVGPYNPSPAKPASYAKIFICAGHDAACTRKILESLERRGFRRPSTEAETQRLLKLVALVQKQGDPFEEGIRIALQSILVSPGFLFRIERDPANTTAAYRVNDYELASRLSYFLWSSMPDDRLLALADQHRLSDLAMMDAQVKRMLQDPKASNLVTDFAEQWLDLRALDRKKPDALKFPTVDDELIADMRHETQLFVNEIFTQDRSLLDLIDGKFTYVNGPLARYYGIRGVDGTKFQRISLEGTERGGLLTQASILTLTSFATRTSPVIRGKWVLGNILGAAPPPPPPNIPALEEKNLGTDASVRSRLEQHRANPACAVCHKQMDPIGFGLENFDAAGGWRTKEGKFDIDSSGTLPDGRSFVGVAELRDILKTQSALFTRNLTEKLLTFALGRGLESSDQVSVDQINQRLTANGNKLSALVTAIVESEPFLMRKKEDNPLASR